MGQRPRLAESRNCKYDELSDPRNTTCHFCARDFFKLPAAVRCILHMPSRNDPCHSGRYNKYQGFEGESLPI